uniref:Uncharacterized protein n=1 Tax=Solanum tuberosum TaxID=4113 RepID=M1CP07_SOLTU
MHTTDCYICHFFFRAEAIGRVAGNCGIRAGSQETQDGLQMTRGNPFFSMLLTLTNSGTFCVHSLLQ